MTLWLDFSVQLNMAILKLSATLICLSQASSAASEEPPVAEANAIVIKFRKPVLLSAEISAAYVSCGSSLPKDTQGAGNFDGEMGTGPERSGL